MIKLRFAAPEMLVDINEIPGLGYHNLGADGSIHIGALCRHADLERSSLLASHQPTMAAAAPLVADPIVRVRGTLVGSLCHADPQGDWASVMTSLDGSVVAEGPKGRRTIPVRDFVRGPFQTVLAVDEIVVEAVVPAPKGVASGGYLKLERRVGDFATAGVAVAIDREGSKVTRAGIALTGVGGSTISADEAAQIARWWVTQRRTDRRGGRSRRSGRPTPHRSSGQCRFQAAGGAGLHQPAPDQTPDVGRGSGLK